ncbi:MAG: flagellar hook-basal body complex protein, partial [Pygmaiobacter massiliensis]|nr:flagellar hook-basal body complex protein [Pygmaiobacter massiliensis]
MFKGFYNLTSGMLTQGRNLDVVANNMTNISTSGYKADRYVASTFKDVLISRVGNKDKTGAQEIGSSSYILASSEVATDYTQGTLETTGMPLDFAIEGAGFFGVQTANGVAYTRGGNFSLDNQGYLYLPGQGRVLGQNGQPILMQTDKITSDNFGRIYVETGNLIGQLGV